MDALFLTNPAQGCELSGEPSGMSPSVKAGVEADGVSLVVELPYQPPGPGMLHGVTRVSKVVGTSAKEVEGVASPVAPGQRVDDVEAVVGIGVAWSKLSGEEALKDAWTLQNRCAAQVMLEVNETRDGVLHGVAHGDIHIMTDTDLKVCLGAFKIGPKTRQARPQDLHVLVHQRPVDESGADSQRGAGGIALKAIPSGSSELFVAGEHKEGPAEQVGADGQRGPNG